MEENNFNNLSVVKSKLKLPGGDDELTGGGGSGGNGDGDTN